MASQKPWMMITTMLFLLTIATKGSSSIIENKTVGLTNTEIKLDCHEYCTCEQQLKDTYHVDCNVSTSQHVLLTDQVLSNATTIEDIQTIVVNLSMAGKATVTPDFLKSWSNFSISVLDIRNVTRLQLHPFVPISDAISLSSKIVIYESHLDQLVGGILGRAKKGILHLVQSSVGSIESNIFQDIEIPSWHVKDSIIGILKSIQQDQEFVISRTGTDGPSVEFQNSVINEIEEGAMRLKGYGDSKVIFQQAAIGRIDKGGIVISNISLAIEDTVIMDLRKGALNVKESGSFIIKNNRLITEPYVLTNLSCANGHIISNNVLAMSTIKERPILYSQSCTPPMGHALSDTDIVCWSRVLDMSCVKENIFISGSECSNKKHPFLYNMNKDEIMFYSLAAATLVCFLILICCCCCCNKNPEITPYTQQTSSHMSPMINSSLQRQDAESPQRRRATFADRRSRVMSVVEMMRLTRASTYRF